MSDKARDEIERLVRELTAASLKAGGGAKLDDRIMRYEAERKAAKVALMSAIDRLLAGSEDARRYRYLLNCTAGEWEDLQDIRLKSQLSAAIDAAIAQEPT